MIVDSIDVTVINLLSATVECSMVEVACCRICVIVHSSRITIVPSLPACAHCFVIGAARTRFSSGKERTLDQLAIVTSGHSEPKSTLRPHVINISCALHYWLTLLTHAACLQKDSRKVSHILAGPGFVASWPLYRRAHACLPVSWNQTLIAQLHSDTSVCSTLIQRTVIRVPVPSAPLQSSLITTLRQEMTGSLPPRCAAHPR